MKQTTKVWAFLGGKRKTLNQISIKLMLTNRCHEVYTFVSNTHIES